MFFKRVAAIAITLLLIVQLTACSKEADSVSSDNSQQTINSQITPSQTVSGEDEQIENNTSNIRPDEDGYYQDRDEIDFGDNQQTDDPKQDSDKNDTSISCVHNGDPYQNVSKADFYADYEFAHPLSLSDFRRLFQKEYT